METRWKDTILLIVLAVCTFLVVFLLVDGAVKPALDGAVRNSPQDLVSRRPSGVATTLIRDPILPHVRTSSRQIAVRVIDETNTAVANALVYAYLTDENGSFKVLGSGRTDDAGESRLSVTSRPVISTVVLGTHADGFLPAILEDASPFAGEIVVRLRRGLSIRGVFTTAMGVPIPGVRIRATNDTSHDRSEPFMSSDIRTDEAKLVQDSQLKFRRSSAITDLHGRFDIRGLSKGDYYLIADHDEWLVSPTIRAAAGDENIALTAVHPSRIVVTAKNSSNAHPVVSFKLDATVTEAMEVPTTRKRRLFASSIGSPFRLAWMLPSDWSKTIRVKVRVQAVGFETVERSVTFARGTQQEIALELTPSARRRIYLNLQWSNSELVKTDVMYRYVDRGAMFGRAENLTRVADGRYWIEVPEGRWAIRVCPHGLLSASLAPVITIDSTSDAPVSVVVGYGGTLECTFRQAGGTITILGRNYSVVRSVGDDHVIVRGLPEGEWVIRHAPDKGQPAEHTIHITSNSWVKLAFD